jgi:hypothetical protein
MLYHINAITLGGGRLIRVSLLWQTGKMLKRGPQIDQNSREKNTHVFTSEIMINQNSREKNVFTMNYRFLGDIM